MHEGETCHHWTIHSPADGYPVAGTAWLLDRLSRDQHLATADFIAHADERAQGDAAGEQGERQRQEGGEPPAAAGRW